MAEREFAYPRAPITEAVLDIRVEARLGLEVDDLLPLKEEMRAVYGDIEDQFELHAQQPGNKGSPDPPAVSTKKIGFRARRAKDSLYQAQIAAFSFHKLAPYDRWASFESEARRIWSLYREVARPVSITRLGLRYINRIDIPAPPPIELSDYLKAYIHFSDELPETQTMSSFFFQVHLPQPDIGGLCVINSGALPTSPPNNASILLDIDVFKWNDAPQSEREVWPFFETLRQRKNSIFEACITPRAQELFR
jgi:uncharacterized protein (TIGR04255 family)